MPLDVFWELEVQLKKMNYLLATGEDNVLIGEVWAKILQKASYYTTREADRVILENRIKGPSEDNQ